MTTYYILQDESLRRQYKAAYDADDETSDATSDVLDKQLTALGQQVYDLMLAHLQTTDEELDNYKTDHMLYAIENVLMDYVEEVLF
jgi:hypothetical protein